MIEIQKLILRDFIERAEAKIGPRSITDIASYGDGEVDPEKLETGWYKLAAALVYARDAIESGDEREIAREALRCQMFLREADAAAARYSHRLGGKATGGKSHAQAEDKYRPHQARYFELLAAGMLYGDARKQVLDDMGTAAPVSTPTINRWFPKPQKM
jgi:hypothetical protein